MKFILNPNVILRGYRNMPYIYYFRGYGNAGRISEKECGILRKMYTPCTAEVFHEKEDVFRRFLRQKLIKEYQTGDKVREYQQYRYCDCAYTPNVNWAVTGKCNYNCLHCFNAGYERESCDGFSREQAFRLIDEFCECGIMNVTITGGEPLLYPDFMDIVRYMDRKGLHLKAINTNGALITQKMLEELYEFTPNTLFKISFDGFGYHDWLRNRQGAEKEALLKINQLLANSFRVQIQTNLHRKNKDSILRTAKVFEALGVERMRIIRTSESPRWKQNGRGMTLTIPEYFDYARYFAKEYADFAQTMQVDIWQVMKLNPRTKSYCYSGSRNHGTKCMKEIPVCCANRHTLAITPEGETVPCNQMSGWMKMNRLSLGNVKEMPLKEILNDGAYRNAIDYSVEELFERNPNICGACRYRFVCLGGCRACAILHGSSESGKGLTGMDAYYGNYDSLKCLFYNEYLSQFEAMWKDRDWKCDNPVFPENNTQDLT